MNQIDPQEERKPEEAQQIVAPQAIEQVTADQPQQATQEQENVLLNLGVLDPGDFQLLAQVLRNNPEMREQILAKASADLGNDTVAKALALLAGVQEPEAPSERATTDAPAAAAPAQAQEESFDYTTSPLALQYDQNAMVQDHADFMRANPAVADQVLAQTAELDVNLALQVAAQFDGQQTQEQAPAQREETPPQVIEETSRAAAEEVRAQPRTEEAATPAPQQETQAEPVVEPEKESGWVVRAREFNAEHADEVAQFLAATGGACMVDGQMDPNLVAQWQSRHGVEVDGRIGSGTVEAAVRQRPETFEQAAQEAQEEQLPEPDPTDPRFAL